MRAIWTGEFLLLKLSAGSRNEIYEHVDLADRHVHICEPLSQTRSRCGSTYGRCNLALVADAPYCATDSGWCSADLGSRSAGEARWDHDPSCQESLQTGLPGGASPPQAWVDKKRSSAQTDEPPVITTIITKLGPEQRRLMRSIELFEHNATVYVASSRQAALDFTNDFPRVRVKVKNILDKYDGLDRNQMTAKGMWTAFQMEKSHILRIALKEEGLAAGAWYMDADTFLFAPLPHVDGPIGLRHHRSSRATEQTFGFYNGGYVFARSLEALSIWEEAAPRAREMCCQDQTALEEVADRMTVAELGCGVDVGWYQMDPFTMNGKSYFDQIQCKDGQVQFDGCTILSMHYHVDDYKGQRIRPFLDKAVRECNHPVLPILLESYVNMTMPPQPPASSSNAFSELQHGQPSWSRYARRMLWVSESGASVGSLRNLAKHP